MGKSTYKIGQLVYCSDSGLGTHGYGNIVDIVNFRTGESYDEIKVITGRGNKNTPVEFKVRIITKGHPNNECHWESDNIVVLSDPEIKICRSHYIYKINLEKAEIEAKKSIERINKKFNFLKTHYLTRDDKLEAILNFNI